MAQGAGKAPPRDGKSPYREEMKKAREELRKSGAESYLIFPDSTWKIDMADLD